MGRAACSVRVRKGQEPETEAIAATEVGAMAPASVKDGEGNKELWKSCVANREVILLVHVVITLQGQSLGVCCVNCQVNTQLPSADESKCQPSFEVRTTF